MSHTPRTDAEVAECEMFGPAGMVRGDFARQLERTNAELLEALQGVMESVGEHELGTDLSDKASAAIARALGK